MIYKIVKYPNPVLSKKCRTIKENSEKLQEIIDNMFETLSLTTGIGLAAPQIGISVRLFITSFRGEKKVFINPIIIEHNEKIKLGIEGCLSLPNIPYNVNRFTEIKIVYLNKNFEKIVEIYTDFYARLVQHEFDHLRGITIADSGIGIN